MNRQGDGAGAPDWWTELYDDDQEDMGHSAGGDTIDDRFDSAARTVAPPAHTSGPPQPVRDVHDEPEGETAPPNEPPPPARSTDGVATEGDTTSGEAPDTQVVVVPHDAVLSDLVPPVGQPKQGDTLVGDTPLGGGATTGARTGGELDAAPPAAPGRAPARSRRHDGGQRPPTYVPEPTELPTADPDRLDELTPDTVLDGARHGELTVRAVSMRGESARSRGRPRQDALLTAKFGSGDRALLLLALASGSRAQYSSHLAAQELCAWIGEAIGRNHVRLAEDLRLERRPALKSGLGRLTARGLGRLRASAVGQGLDPSEYGAGLRCLLLPADPHCRVRLFFGAGGGGLFRLREGEWQDLEPTAPGPEPATGELARDSGQLGPKTPPFLFRTSLAEPGDALLLCTAGLADPMQAESDLRAELAQRWGVEQPPGLAEFLTDSQLCANGYVDDRSAVGVWEPPPRRR